MRSEQLEWLEGRWNGTSACSNAGLVFVFGSGSLLADPQPLNDLRDRYPGAVLFGCSTAGEVVDTSVSDGGLVATALEFNSTTVRLAASPVDQDASATGARLAESLAGEGLRHVVILSDGLLVNGSRLVDGVTSLLPRHVAVTGGLAADGTAFKKTLVLADRRVESGMVAAVGFYGSAFRVSYASLGGWDSFGPERIVTRSRGNVLLELDGHSALDLYRRYLGDHASDLPSSGLLFPLSVRAGRDGEALVRTLLAIDEEEGSMTFAGDVPQGSTARLMKSNFDRLVDGANDAAAVCRDAVAESPCAALLISCVGRKLILKQRTDEEIEAVRAVLGPDTTLSGFYSYGEISPFTPAARCQLHNQTMTITTFAEV